MLTISQPPINIAIRIAVEWDFFEAVSATKDGSITAREIAQSKNVDEVFVGMSAALKSKENVC